MMSWFFNLFKSKAKKETTVVELPEYYKIALKESGVTEIVGSKHSSRVLEYHHATSLKASDDETPWCAAFVNWCLLQAGIPGTNSALARSFQKWGIPAFNPKEGDIVVLWRDSKISTKGHVGFFVKRDAKYVYIFGGNQGNKVCLSKYPIERVLTYRMPESNLPS